MLAAGRHRKQRLAAILLAAATLGAPAQGQEAQAAERAAKVMAAFLRHIAAETTWPGQKFPAAGRPLVVGTLGPGDSRVIDALRTGIEKRPLWAQGRALELRRIDTSAGGPIDRQLDGCHLLFVPAAESSRWPAVREQVEQMAIVTVSNVPGFASARGMVEFVVEERDSRVRMHIDLAAVDCAQLRISSKILRYARIVRRPSGACADAPAGEEGDG